MGILAVLLGVLIEHFYDRVDHWRRYEVFHAYVDWLHARLRYDWMSAALELLLILLPVMGVTALLGSALADILWGLPGLGFAILVLVVCLGPRDWRSQLQDYQEALAVGDEAATQRLAKAWLGERPDDPQQQHRAVLEAAFVAANERVFGVLCWFLLLGPAGAVGYRAVKELVRHPLAGDPAFAAGLEWLQAVLDWLPSRIMVIGFALAGHFDNVLRAWRNAIHEAGWGMPAGELLDRVGCAALDVGLPENWAPVFAAALELLQRTLIIWLFFLAVLTITGWLA